MNVKLIDYQKNALEILLYTKNTRLQGAQSLQDIINWPEEKKLEHLSYMRDTIKSSWEFSSYTFEINDVTRALTHQLVRTRTGSYAQESQRTVDASNNGYYIPDGVGKGIMMEDYCMSMNNGLHGYKNLLELGADIQDARGVLPTNLHTNIIAKFDLRTLHQMAEVRLCKRTQGEYQDLFKLMKEAVIWVHPWAEDFINVYCVNHGVCCFPRYKECPIQKHTIKISDIQKQEIKTKWGDTKHVAVPVAKDGMTMEQDEVPSGCDKCGNCEHYELCENTTSIIQAKCEEFKWDGIPF